MKTNRLVILIATCVAICSPHKTRSQDATLEQLQADYVRQEEQKADRARSAALAAEHLSKLTPEQLKMRTETIERIKKTLTPPIPSTERPSVRKMPLYTKDKDVPPLSPGQRLQLRTTLMTALFMDGWVGSQQSADYLNASINSLSSESADVGAIAESAYALAIVSSEEPQMRNLMESAREIDYISDPFNPVNTYPFPANFNAWPWWTENVAPSYVWSTIPRTLVDSNGPAAQSYQFPLAQVGNSQLRTLIDNHYDQLGNPVRHIIAFWYTLTNLYSAPPFGSDSAEFAVQVGLFNGSLNTTTNALKILLSETPTGWNRPAYVVSPMAKRNENVGTPGVTYYQLRAIVLKQNLPNRLPNKSTPLMRLDPSIQWIPYWLQPISEDFITEKVGNQAWVQWNTIAYPTNSFKLTFATNPLGPWSDQIGVPVSYTNEVATAKFLANNPARFYRLENR